jgi:hypothetical protein
MSKMFFRYLVGGSIALQLVAVAILLMFEQTLPGELEAWADAQAETAWTAVDWLGIAAAGVAAAASVGLLFFARWARPAYAACTFLTIAANAFTGPYVLPGIDGFFNDITLLLDGLIIAAAYFSGASRYFEKSPAATPRAMPEDARVG